MIRYLSGGGCYLEDGTAQRLDIGLMIQPGNSYYRRVGKYGFWAADNGAFSAKFSEEKFRKMLNTEQAQTHKKTCLFVAAPDVMGDPISTLEKYSAWAEYIRSLGYLSALVAQDGLENMLDEVPWGVVDVVFLGGSTEWKLSTKARVCVEAAQGREKKTHMGRVNSYKRLKLANSWGVDTADGTFLRFGGLKTMAELVRWFERLNG